MVARIGPAEKQHRNRFRNNKSTHLLRHSEKNDKKKTTNTNTMLWQGWRAIMASRGPLRKDKRGSPARGGRGGAGCMIFLLPPYFCFGCCGFEGLQGAN